MNPTISIVNRHEAHIEVPAEMLDSGSSVQVAEIDINRNGRTARFWVSVKVSNCGSPIVSISANNASKDQQVHGTFLDLNARRAEKGLPPI